MLEVELDHRVVQRLELRRASRPASRIDSGGSPVASSCMSRIRSSFARHVAVERHRGVAQPRRDGGHRDGAETLGIRDLDRGLDDALDAHLALGTALRAGGDAPRERDAAGQFEFDPSVSTMASF